MTGRQAGGLEFAAGRESAVVQEGIGREAVANNALEFAGSGSQAALEAIGIEDVARAHIAELVFVLAELADTGRGVVVQVGPALAHLADAQTEGLETGNCCKAEQSPSRLANNGLNLRNFLIPMYRFAKKDLPQGFMAIVPLRRMQHGWVSTGRRIQLKH